MKTKSKELSVICFSQLTHNINNSHDYYYASMMIATCLKQVSVDEFNYYLLSIKPWLSVRVDVLLKSGSKAYRFNNNN